MQLTGNRTVAILFQYFLGIRTLLKPAKDAGQKLASLPIFELRVFRSKNSVVLLYTAIRGGNDAVQKLATFFKNVIFEKLESQFTIIQNTDIVN